MPDLNTEGDPGRPRAIVGVGMPPASRAALETLLGESDPGAGLAFVVVRSLASQAEPAGSGRWESSEGFRVVEAVDGTVIEPGVVYEAPGDRLVWIEGGRLRVGFQGKAGGDRRAIDHLFRSLARDGSALPVGVLLAPEGRDGLAGLVAIRAAGGLSVLLAANPGADPDAKPGLGPDEADRRSVPEGMADLSLPIDRIPGAVVDFVRRPFLEGARPAAEAGAVDDDEQEVLDELARLLADREGFDPSRYKPGTVRRRVRRRAALLGIDRLGPYLELLREHAEERRRLIDDLLIGVTGFFRDPEAFRQLRSQAIAELVDRASPGESIRVWVAGCSTGEEAYSVALLLLEAARESGKGLSVTLFATDIDEEALRVARRGAYPAEALAELDPGLMGRYFEPVEEEEGRVRVRPDLRDAVSFAVQDLAIDPPFPRLHLICCRNVLIYFRREQQETILSGFRFALRPGGFLFLGTSEAIPRDDRAFVPVSAGYRIFRRPLEAPPSLLMPTPTPTPTPMVVRSSVVSAPPPGFSPSDRAREALVAASLPASVVIDGDDRALYFHGDLRRFLDLPRGAPTLDVLRMLRPELGTRVRAAVYSCRREGLPVAVEAAMGADPVEGDRVRVVVRPLPEDRLGPGAVAVGFEPIPASEPPSPEPIGPDRAADDLHRELLAIREDLRSTVQELERRNAELRSANDESVAMNEELRLTNEELEATTEELRSVNEELATVNAQLKERLRQLRSAHDDLANLFASAELAAVFLDDQLRVQRITPSAARLLRLPPGPMESPIDEMPGELVDDDLISLARQVLADLAPRESERRTEDGRWFLRRARPYRTADRRVEGVVLTFEDMTDLRAAVERSRLREQQQAAVARLGFQALSIADLDELLHRAVRQVALVLDADLVKILELKPDGDLLLRAGVGWSPGLVGSARVPTGVDSQAGYTMSVPEPVIVDDLARERRFQGPALLIEHDVVSGISCTISAGVGSPFGVLSAHTTRPRSFSPDDANFLRSVANLVADTVARHRVEQDLRRGEEQFRLALAEAPLPAIMAAEDGEILLVNHAFRRITGYSAEELPNLASWAALAYGDRAAEVRSGIDALFEQFGYTHEGEFVIRTRDGGRRTWDFHTTGLGRLKDGRRAFISMALDVTDRKLSERELGERETQLRLATDAARVGIWSIDYETGRVDLSGHGESIFGVEPGEPLTREQLLSRIHPDDLPAVRASTAASSDPLGDGRFEFEHRLTPPGGPERWLSVRGQVAFEQREGRLVAVRSMGTVVDVTARKMADLKIREVRRLLQAFLDASPDFIYGKRLDGRYILANQGFLELLGISAGELLGAEDPAPFETEESRLLLALDRRVFEQGRPMQFEQSLEVSGRTRHYLVTRFPLRNDEGKVEAVCGIATDITRQKRAERSLLEADRRKTQYLATLAHELRNPLAAAAAAVELLDEPGDDQEQIEAAEIIGRQIRHLTRLIDDLMDVSRISRGKVHLRRVRIRLDEAARNAVRDVAELIASRRHELVDRPPAEPVWVDADPTRLSQILVNLLTNAARYTEPGGRIELEVARQGDQAMVTVSDTGKGIEPELLETIFEPFSQLSAEHEEPYGGLGIGLTLVRDLVRLHGGRIRAESEGPGRGSRFLVLLPAANGTPDIESTHDRAIEPAPSPGPAPEPEPEPAPDSKPEPSGRRVLLVDDNRDLARILTIQLRSLGHDVRPAADGDEALAVAASMAPEVVLLDLGLPGRDGVAVGRELRELPGLERVRLVAMSGYGQPGDRDRTRAAGFERHLVKPVDLDELARIIDRPPPEVAPDPGTPPPTLDGAEKNPAAADPSSAGADPLRVLIIDDQRPFTYLARRVVARQGYVVATADSAPSGIDLAKRFRPGLVLCDLMLGPDGDGFEVARALRADPSTRSATLIAVSGSADPDREARARAAGFDLFLTKPVDLDDLASLRSRASRG